MNTKSKWIIFLLAITATLFCIIEFHAIPAKQASMDRYKERQTDALTHDISSIQDYKKHYLTDASNTCNLMNSLPMSNISKTFEIDETALTVNYQEYAKKIGIEKVQRNLIYNSFASMASIDALAKIEYTFYDKAYVFSREELDGICSEHFNQESLPKLLVQSTWEKTVRQELKNPDFAHKFSAFADSYNN